MKRRLMSIVRNDVESGSHPVPRVGTLGCQVRSGPVATGYLSRGGSTSFGQAFCQTTRCYMTSHGMIHGTT